jgi:hypothetical protein
VGIYRHYLAIFLAMTGQIAHALPHPKCHERYRVLSDDYFIPLRLGLLDSLEAPAVMRHIIPGCQGWTDSQLKGRIEWMG